jgi:hypothetical protein
MKKKEIRKGSIPMQTDVAATGLHTDSEMSVDAGVTGRSCQVFVFPVRNMEMTLWVAVLLCQSEVDNINLVSTLANAHQKVVWLDIAMNEVLGMDIFDARDLRA